jgi:phosphoenolpyruvate carboxylase
MAQQIDAPLREDVRLLGNLLGETLKLHAGQDLFNQVEQIRALSKGARDGQLEAEKQLEQLFLSLEDDEILPLTRAFTHFLNFANIAEHITWSVVAVKANLMKLPNRQIPWFHYLKNLNSRKFPLKAYISRSVN